ncbi:hypothetical protein G4G27_09975 [Sphingomonas sp. So64.6b]|uniref:hypothetical protein n=1 Tax=Sphingomonas sp. So64.6b TaxID=2997354 RepID=UPI0016028E0C|nr:hypothetical protein [Sphingomonas sp. So64.6b]QNA84277.1 hypothetical protein G4G27_09975 [Sphingomonas sp. So64.6b]
MKRALLLAGVVVTLMGLFFGAQGGGMIMWPASSFMLAQGEWVIYGAIIAAFGVGLIVWSRRA